MTSLSFNRAPLSLIETGVGIIGILLGLLNKLARASEDRWAMHTLSGLTDRELQDIGILRSQIEDAVKGNVKAGTAFRSR